MAHLNSELGKLPQAVAFAFPPPAIQGIGLAGGATLVLEDRAGKDISFLAENVNKFIEAARKRPELARVTTTFLPAVPQLFVNVDRDKVLKQGVDLAQVYQTLQTFMGGYFINYFNRFGRQWQVYVQAEGEYRTKAENVGQFYVLNDRGDPVPLSALTTIESRPGPEFTMRYNLYRSAQINAMGKPGFSSAQVMKALEEVFQQTMPAEMGLRLRRHELPGKEGTGRDTGLSHLRIFSALRFSDPCRPVRELVPARSACFSVPRLPYSAPSPASGCATGKQPGEQQRLCPDRPHRPHRPCRKERHPDRRIRQDET